MEDDIPNAVQAAYSRLPKKANYLASMKTIRDVYGVSQGSLTRALADFDTSGGLTLEHFYYLLDCGIISLDQRSEPTPEPPPAPKADMTHAEAIRQLYRCIRYFADPAVTPEQIAVRVVEIARDAACMDPDA